MSWSLVMLGSPSTLERVLQFVGDRAGEIHIVPPDIDNDGQHSMGARDRDPMQETGAQPAAASQPQSPPSRGRVPRFVPLSPPPVPRRAGRREQRANTGTNERSYNAVAMSASGSVTGLLLAWGKGDDDALGRLIPLVERELHRIARRCMAGERAGHSLQATALVNEAYLRLVDVQHVNWQDRAHFLAMSARLMRRILVDWARSKQYQKRGGGAMRVTFTEALPIADDRGHDLVALDTALEALAAFDARKATVIELRFFGGLSVEETAAVLKVSPDTVMRDWKLAKAWLLREMRPNES